MDQQQILEEIGEKLATLVAAKSNQDEMTKLKEELKAANEKNTELEEKFCELHNAFLEKAKTVRCLRDEIRTLEKSQKTYIRSCHDLEMKLMEKEKEEEERKNSSQKCINGRCQAEANLSEQRIARFDKELLCQEERIADLQNQLIQKTAEIDRTLPVIGRQELDIFNLKQDLLQKEEEIQKFKKIEKTEKNEITELKIEIRKLWNGIRDLLSDKTELQTSLKQKFLELEISEKKQKIEKKVEGFEMINTVSNGNSEILKQEISKDEQEEAKPETANHFVGVGDEYWHKDYTTPSEDSEIVEDVEDMDYNDW